MSKDYINHMKCPKNMSNGPCGGVRQNDCCEILPDMRCIWVNIWQEMKTDKVPASLVREYQAPADQRLEDMSA